MNEKLTNFQVRVAQQPLLSAISRLEGWTSIFLWIEWHKNEVPTYYRTKVMIDFMTYSQDANAQQMSFFVYWTGLWRPLVYLANFTNSVLRDWTLIKSSGLGLLTIIHTFPWNFIHINLSVLSVHLSNQLHTIMKLQRHEINK